MTNKIEDKFKHFEQDLIFLLDLYDFRLGYDECAEQTNIYAIAGFADHNESFVTYDLDTDSILWNSEWANK